MRRGRPGPMARGGSGSRAPSIAGAGVTRTSSSGRRRRAGPPRRLSRRPTRPARPASGATSAPAGASRSRCVNARTRAAHRRARRLGTGEEVFLPHVDANDDGPSRARRPCRETAPSRVPSRDPTANSRAGERPGAVMRPSSVAPRGDGAGHCRAVSPRRRPGRRRPHRSRPGLPAATQPPARWPARGRGPRTRRRTRRS